MVVHAYRSRAKGVSNLTRIRDLISKTSGCVESLEAREGGGEREREEKKLANSRVSNICESTRKLGSFRFADAAAA